MNKNPMTKLRRQAGRNLAKGRGFMARAFDFIVFRGLMWIGIWWILGRHFRGWSGIFTATLIWSLLQLLFWIWKRRRITREVNHLLAQARRRWLQQMPVDDELPFRIAYACNCAILGESSDIIWEVACGEGFIRPHPSHPPRWRLVEEREDFWIIQGIVRDIECRIVALWHGELPQDWLQEWQNQPYESWTLFISPTEHLTPQGCEAVTGERLLTLLEAWDRWPDTVAEKAQLAEYASQLIAPQNPTLSVLKEALLAPEKGWRYLLYGGLLQALSLMFRLKGLYPWMGVVCVMLGLICLWRGYRTYRSTQQAAARLVPDR